MALAEGLKERGTDVIVISTIDSAQMVEDADLPFVSFGQKAMGKGYLSDALLPIVEMGEEDMLKYLTTELVRRCITFCEAAFAELPDLITAKGCDALLIDQGWPGGSVIAEHLKLPFVSFCAALPMNRDSIAPSPLTPYMTDSSVEGLERNRLSWEATTRISVPIKYRANKQRRIWNLAPNEDGLQSQLTISPLLELAQIPPGFDFPRQLPHNIRYLGPFRRPSSTRKVVPFPFSWLDGRRLIYASLGTINRLRWVFDIIIEASRGLDAQVVLSLGGADIVMKLQNIPENVLVVAYAPQEELIKSATLCITHAGQNTTGDCLTYGVPMVAIPFTTEQPGTAARIAWTKTGVALSLSTLTTNTLRSAIDRTLANPVYKSNSQKFAAEMRSRNPIQEACELIHTAVEKARSGFELS